ncbi:MAG: sigma 54-interacting transcriptional regulator, partial [Candidatus Poribacteria bacterium]|nr:sigma 54-interacting transcriptional regulator [Candidatus Poribacteria bacterium]
MNPRILIVDDDSSGLEATAEVLKREGYDLFTATGARAAIQILDAENVDVVITDEKMPDMSGIELLKYILANHPYTQVILLTAYGSIDSAVEAIQTGAVSYREKPIRIELLRQTVKSALERRTLHLQNVNLRQQLDGKFGFANITGTSKPMQDLFGMVRRIAPTNVTVLITGENGVGKELIAKAVHNHSRRKDRLFRDLNCGAIPRELVEGELFGHEKGAFTSATARRFGVFEQADGG